MHFDHSYLVPPSLQVVVTTADENFAAFDGDLFLTFGGPQGQSQEVQLTTEDPSAKPFAVNAAFTFTVQGGDVGPIATLLVRPVSAIHGAFAQA